MTVRLSGLADAKSLLNPNQYDSLPGLSTFDTCLSLTHEIRTLKRPKLRVSTLFLNIKAGFDNANDRILRSSLLAKSIPSYIIN